MNFRFNSASFVLIGFVVAAASLACAMWFFVWWLGLGALAALPLALHLEPTAREIAVRELNSRKADLVSGTNEFYAVVAGYLVSGKPSEDHYRLVAQLAQMEIGSDQANRVVRRARKARMLLCELNAVEEIQYRSDGNDVLVIGANQRYTCSLPQRRDRKQLLALLSHEGFHEVERSTRRSLTTRPFRQLLLALTIAFSVVLFITAFGYAAPEGVPLPTWQDAEIGQDSIDDMLLVAAALSQAYLYLVNHLSPATRAVVAVLIAAVASFLLYISLWGKAEFVVLRRTGQSD